MAQPTAVTQLRVEQQLEAVITTITPDIAEKWLGKNETNRNIRAPKVADLARDMTAGRWHLTGDSIKFDWNGNLIDGQHRLTAIRESGATVTCLIVRGLAPEVRTVIDTGAKRTAGDALRMSGLAESNNNKAAATIRLLLGVQRGQIKRAGDASPSATHSEVLDFYRNHAETLTYCVTFASKHCRSIKARPSALAAAMFMAGVSGRIAEFTAFATAVAELNFRGTGDPRATLYRRMESLRDEPHENSEEIYFILRAFTAFIDSKTLGSMKASTGPGRSIIPTFGWGAAA